MKLVSQVLPKRAQRDEAEAGAPRAADSCAPAPASSLEGAADHAGADASSHDATSAEVLRVPHNTCDCCNTAGVRSSPCGGPALRCEHHGPNLPFCDRLPLPHVNRRQNLTALNVQSSEEVPGIQQRIAAFQGHQAQAPRDEAAGQAADPEQLTLEQQEPQPADGSVIDVDRLYRSVQEKDDQIALLRHLASTTANLPISAELSDELSAAVANLVGEKGHDLQAWLQEMADERQRIAVDHQQQASCGRSLGAARLLRAAQANAMYYSRASVSSCYKRRTCVCAASTNVR